jgi:hypothetical protein
MGKTILDSNLNDVVLSLRNENKFIWDPSSKCKVIMIKHINIKVGKCHNISVYKAFSPYFNGWQKRLPIANFFLLIRLFWPNIQLKYIKMRFVIKKHRYHNRKHGWCHNIRFYEEFCDILKCAIFSNRSILKRAYLGRVGLIAVWKLISIYFDSMDN